MPFKKTHIKLTPFRKQKVIPSVDRVGEIGTHLLSDGGVIWYHFYEGWFGTMHQNVPLTSSFHF